MSEKNEKKQVAIIWLLTVLIEILIVVIIGLFITVVKAKREAKIGQQYEQMQETQIANTIVRTEKQEETNTNQIKKSNSSENIGNELDVNSLEIKKLYI